MIESPGPDASSHFNNWPNDQGFDANYEQRTPVELPVTGEIPAYAAGVLYRTGPGRFKVDTEKGDTFHVSHFFDGFSQTHRFQLVASETSGSGMRVLYNSRFSSDGLIEDVRKEGSLGIFTFSPKGDPCKILYKKFQSTYEPQEAASHTNNGVTLSVNMPGLESSSSLAKKDERWSDIRTLYAKTDSSKLKKIHPETLEPLGMAEQKDLHPDLDGHLSASHARSDPKTGDLYNYNLSFAPSPTYRVFCVSAATGETTILASFPGVPSYIHSIFLTEDYVVVCAWNAEISPAKFADGSYLEAIQPFDPLKPAMWYVVDRKHGKGLVAMYNSPAFFCFHSINAWQEPSPTDPSKTDIVAECIMFENLNFLFGAYYELLMSSSPKAHRSKAKNKGVLSLQSKIARFRLPSISAARVTDDLHAAIDWTACQAFSPEFPAHNPAYSTRPHRYTYAVVDRGESTFFDGLVKFDSKTNETVLWHCHAHSPGEAIFVADPKGTREDDGVLLSVVLDGMTGRSYLLCLDAKTMAELGRAQVGGPVGFGFHGQHISTKGVATGDY